MQVEPGHGARAGPGRRWRGRGGASPWSLRVGVGETGSGGPGPAGLNGFRGLWRTGAVPSWPWGGRGG